MTAAHMEGHKPLPRSESLQKMLDLEKQCKFARMQKVQTSPTPPHVSAMSFQHQIQPPVPLQTRRRNSRESLGQQHQQQQQQQQQQYQHHYSLEQIPIAVRRSGPASPLSITIPSPVDSGAKGQLSQRSLKATLYNMTAEGDGKEAAHDSQGDTTPRGKTTKSTTNGQFNEEDDEVSESDQSSICQSPSWEDYGKKKKDKKKEAQQRKKEKERLDQELRAANKKRASNRLYKNPPPDSPDPNGLRERPPSSASTRLDSSHGTKLGRFTPSHQSKVTEIWAIGMGSGLGVPMSRPPYSRAASAAGSTADQDLLRSAVPTATQLQLSNASANRGLLPPADERPTSSSNDKVSYPPTSSRSHALRGALPGGHRRQASASIVTALPPKLEDKSNQVYPANDGSDQTLDQATAPIERGRQSAESGAVPGSSYVRRARAQSIERSIKGFMQEAALSDPNLLNGPNRTQFAYLGPSQQISQTKDRRPSSSHSRITQPFGKINGSNGVSNDNAAQFTPTTSAMPERVEKPMQQSQQELKQRVPSRGEVPSAPQEQLVLPRADIPDKDGDTSADYLNFVSKPYSPPSLDLTTPTSGGGIFTSIKTRIGRRSSTSSGSTSNTNTGRSFKERAMGAMHLHSSQPMAPTAALATTSQPPSRMHSQNSSQTAASSAMSSTKNETASSVPISHNLQILHRDTRHLPKAARVLGEVNQETMSQGPAAPSRPSEGSSTSSYHNDSSVPPSPASTPDTSRPQSAKGLSATIEEIKIGSPRMFLPGQEDVSKPETQNAKAARPRPPANQNAVEETMPPRPFSRTESVRDASVDRPHSKGRLLDDLERPGSRGRILENVERPGSSGRVLEEPRPIHATEPSTKDIAVDHSTESSSSSSPDLAEGLGILDEAWSQSTVTPDNDAQSFVTTLTNQKSGTSLKSQFGSLKDAALLAEAQGALGVHPALINHDIETPAPPAYHSTLQEVDEADFADSGVVAEKTYLRSNNNLRKKENRTSQHAKHMSVVSEEPQADDRLFQRASSPVFGGNDPRKTSTDVSFLPALRHEAFVPPRSKARKSAPPPPRSYHVEVQQVPQDDEILAHHPDQAHSSSGRSSPSAMYLQEARRSAPLVSSPLSNVIRSAKANMSTPSLARPGLKTSTSFSGAGGHLPLPPPPPSSSSAPYSSSPAQQPTSAPTSPPPRIAARESEQLAKAISSAHAKPLAKMLVECCHCKFFHDMPSRVYECMAQPDAVVTDRDLGVSGAITTMVKCPWCSHNMSTQCCAGYAAMVYLKERMH